jgi:hypothetical protein
LRPTAGDARSGEERDAPRRFVLTRVQPGLGGLIDGSGSTLAPIFAAAFATGDTWNTVLVGPAAPRREAARAPGAPGRGVGRDRAGGAWPPGPPASRQGLM